ncbi:MAG: tetratricopeptide repeat protein, partial [Actinomycetota bacterium]
MKRWGAYVTLLTVFGSSPGWAQAAKPTTQSRTSPSAAAARLIDQSDELTRKGKFEEAAALLQKAAELTPEDWALWDAVGWAHLDNSKLPEATKAFEAARKAAPPGTPMLAGPVVVSYALGKKDELSKLLAQLTPSDRLPEVMAVVEKGLAAKRFTQEWNYALGYVYANVLRNSGRALGLIEAVAKADPKRADAWLLLVEINRDLERSAQEDAAAVKYLELAPESADAFRLRAERAAALREYPTAIAEYKAGIEKAPGAEHLYYQLARVYERTGAEKEAEGVYRQLIAYAESKKLTGMRQQARAALGAFQLRHRKYVDAEPYYREMAAAPDATVSTWENWGAALALLAKWDEAAKAMKGAAERLGKTQTPGDPEARDTLLAARYRAGVYEVAAGRREDAAKTLDT